MANTITILHPGVEVAPASAVVARPNSKHIQSSRLSGLSGKRLALLDNGKVNSGPILVAIAERLQSRHGVAEFRSWKKRHAGDSGAAVIPALLEWKPDFALTAIGD